MNIILLYI